MSNLVQESRSCCSRRDPPVVFERECDLNDLNRSHLQVYRGPPHGLESIGPPFAEQCAAPCAIQTLHLPKKVTRHLDGKHNTSMNRF